MAPKMLNKWIGWAPRSPEQPSESPEDGFGYPLVWLSMQNGSLNTIKMRWSSFQGHPKAIKNWSFSPQDRVGDPQAWFGYLSKLFWLHFHRFGTSLNSILQPFFANILLHFVRQSETLRWGGKHTFRSHPFRYQISSGSNQMAGMVRTCFATWIYMYYVFNILYNEGGGEEIT